MSGKRSLPTFHIVIPGSPDELDKKLRLLAGDIAHKMEMFKPLIAEAKSKEIHKDLGFNSWPAYIADVIGKCMRRLPADDRAQIVTMLAGEGMSNRAIADAVGVSHPTVIRDRAAVEVVHPVPPEPATVTGIDGKSYPPRPKPEPKPKRRKPITKVFDRLAYDATRMAGRIGKLASDDRLTRNQYPLLNYSLSELVRLRDALDDLIQFIPAEQTPDRSGATRYSREIQRLSASIAESCTTLTGEEISEALGAAQFLYELLRGETILRDDPS